MIINGLLVEVLFNLQKKIYQFIQIKMNWIGILMALICFTIN
tara:strand:+ start:172 stop:297 length:126 start_codon:yes stop_codon:yes gene_type:complete